MDDMLIMLNPLTNEGKSLQCQISDPYPAKDLQQAAKANTTESTEFTLTTLNFNRKSRECALC